MPVFQYFIFFSIWIFYRFAFSSCLKSFVIYNFVKQGKNQLLVNQITELLINIPA